MIKTQLKPSTLKFQYFHIPFIGYEARNEFKGNLDNPVFSCSLLSSEYISVDVKHLSNTGQTLSYDWHFYVLTKIWTVKINQSILKEISSEYSLGGLMLKLKLQYFGHWCEELTH